MHFFPPERPTKAHGWHQASLPFLLFPSIYEPTFARAWPSGALPLKSAYMIDRVMLRRIRQSSRGRPAGGLTVRESGGVRKSDDRSNQVRADAPNGSPANRLECSVMSGPKIAAAVLLISATIACAQEIPPATALPITLVGGRTYVRLRFDQVGTNGRDIAITTSLRAVASSREVQEAQLPQHGPILGESPANWTTTHP